MKTPVDLSLDALLLCAEGFSYACLLNSNGAPERQYDWLLALGARQVIRFSDAEALEGIQSLGSAEGRWLFGFLGYDAKNSICLPEQRLGRLHSALPSRCDFADACWFEPEFVFLCQNGQIKQVSGDDSIWEKAESGIRVSDVSTAAHYPATQCDTDEESYSRAVESIRSHIREGDVYEVNLCVSFFAERVQLNPLQFYRALNQRTRAPFSAWLKCDQEHIICASPERFLARRGQSILSQPIKGTAARGSDADSDAALKQALLQSEKDRAENIMIVDLVRNDLARCCLPGSVVVTELCGLHSFDTLHHLISTVEGHLQPGSGFSHALKACFPMGSMTGAPKLMALELIEQYEWSRRGPYSGCMGYISPSGDFDLNVIIRSLIYNQKSLQASWPAGGAITWDSKPEEEWKEIQVKAKAIQDLLRSR